jgi:hypothetical protein
MDDAANLLRGEDNPVHQGGSEAFDYWLMRQNGRFGRLVCLL